MGSSKLKNLLGVQFEVMLDEGGQFGSLERGILLRDQTAYLRVKE